MGEEKNDDEPKTNLGKLIKNCSNSWINDTGLNYHQYKRLHRDDKWEAHKISDFIYLGGIQSATNYYKLLSLEITYVLNCAETIINPRYKEFNMEYLVLEAKDKPHYDLIGKHLNESIEFIEKARKNDAKILIHCMGGVNRSATILTAYFLYYQQMNSMPICVLDAAKLLLVQRPFVLKNEGFQKQLLHYESHLRKQQQMLQKENKKKQKRGKRHSEC